MNRGAFRGHIYSRQVILLNGCADMNRQTVSIKFQNRVNVLMDVAVAWNGFRNFQIQYQAKYTAFHKGITVCLVSALALIFKTVKNGH